MCRTTISASVLLALCLAACGDDGGARPDLGPDLADDISPDAALDVTPDLQPDATHDGGSDLAADPSTEQGQPTPTTVEMDFTRHAGFYAAPFPDESRRGLDGAIDLSDFPPPGRVALVEALLRVLESAEGFATTSTIYFTTTAPIDVDSLPALLDSEEPGAALLLTAIDSASPDYGLRLPFSADFAADATPFGAANLLSMLPLQGRPLRPETRYLAAVTTAVRDASGTALAPSPAIALLASGGCPEGLAAPACADYRAGLAALAELGVATSEVAGLAVFRTWDPTAGLYAGLADARALEPPAPVAPLALHETFDGYCVFVGELDLPVFQGGSPPFQPTGGGWVTEDGRLVQQGTERARLVVTLPRRAAPEAGFPTAVFVRTGGGGDRPLVDRGVRTAPGGPAAAPGSGPARELAAAGFAGVMVDGPHGGARNPTGGDEQLLVFNFTNPFALRDNLRQSALELALLPDVLDDLRVDASECPGLASDDVGFDLDHLALMGHSMGATIAPLVLAAEPRYGLGILSGAGGSWIENVIYKESPLRVRPIAEAILGYRPGALRAHDPALMLMQWAGEPADPPVFARDIVAAPGRDLLMLQGIVDTYILPSIANATSLSLGLDLVGEPLDATEARLDGFVPLEALLREGQARHGFPVQGNRDGGAHTAAVVQHPEDGVEDGHEVMFQTEAPKVQYRCFLETSLAGTPVLVDGAGADLGTPCAELVGSE
jgi:hypothetical protein